MVRTNRLGSIRKYRVAVRYRLSKDTFINIKAELGESQLGYYIRGGLIKQAKELLNDK